MQWLVPYATALLLGSVHALEADHMAAVTAFAARRPRPLASMLFGVRWAAGHGMAIVVVGSVLLVGGTSLPQGFEHGLERAVGLALIALGAWTLAGARRLHAHSHVHADGTSHSHLHSHALQDGHRHGHGVTTVGLLHGLAGTAPAVALVPVTTVGSVAGGVGYLVLFAIGTAAGMALYAFIAGILLGRMADRSVSLARAGMRLAGLATIAVGMVWLIR